MPCLHQQGITLSRRHHEPAFREEFQKRLIWNDTLRRRVRLDVEALRRTLSDAAFGDDDGVPEKDDAR